MNTEGAAAARLVRIQPGSLSTLGTASLAARGLMLLRNAQEAESWLQKGRALLESAPAHPWGMSWGPINPYAQHTLAGKLQITFPAYIRQVLNGTSPQVAARNARMSRDDQELAHIAQFFMPELLHRVAYGPRRSNDAGSKTPTAASLAAANPIPYPTGMSEGSLSSEILQRALQIGDVLESLVMEESRKLAALNERRDALVEAYQCFQRGYELDPQNAELLYQLALCYLSGEGVEQDEMRGLGLCMQASSLGHEEARELIEEGNP